MLKLKFSYWLFTRKIKVNVDSGFGLTHLLFCYLDVRTAAARGVADRLRPILSTSLTTIVGMIPLGLSDPVWFPLCAAVGLGLMASTAIALFVIPGLYLQLTPNLS